MAVALAMTAAALTSCSSPSRSPERPGDPKIPAIEWPRGEPGSNGFDSQWTDVILDYWIAYAAAYNERSVSSAARLRELTTAEANSLHADVDYFEGTTYFPGPLPILVTDLSIDGSTAQATVCSDNGWETPSARNEEDRMNQIRLGIVSYWDLVKNENGSVRIASHVGASGEHCSLEGVKYGLFDPRPPYGELRAPDGD